MGQLVGSALMTLLSLFTKKALKVSKLTRIGVEFRDPHRYIKLTGYEWCWMKVT